MREYQPVLNRAEKQLLSINSATISVSSSVCAGSAIFKALAMNTDSSLKAASKNDKPAVATAALKRGAAARGAA